jgi:hypothetical protein
MGKRDEVWQHGENLFFRVQVHVLFKRILRGWGQKVEGAFGGDKWKYFSVQ